MIYFLLILQQFISSTTHIFAKNLTFELPPTTILLLRSFFAAIFFLILIVARNGKLLKIGKRDIPKFLILGALNIPLNQYLFFTSINLTTPPNVALAYALSPIFILVVASYFLKERIQLRKVFGVIIAFIGITIVLVEKGVSLRSEFFLGNLIAITASISWAFYSVYGKPLILKYGSIYTTGMSMILGLILYLPFSIINKDFSNLTQVQVIHLSQIVYLAIMTSGVAYLIWYYALKRLPASNVGIFNNFQPIFTTILSVIFFSQQISPFFVVGGILVILGVTITQKDKNHVVV
ncbi:MAG: DMT family transporter [Ignavibacteria bacterium]|nr:DMT family transporter [Ignavibacteria bacterium]